ncbi:MAG: LPXTG cell wall anchor domain-containing protein [Streptomycetaceae bacterium]|nr:LPXTG cell wall anchor domain-containing protein [Streptomycetaceae bacterium]
MASRRSLTTTAAAAGALLAAIYFVPSASASVEHPEHAHAPATRTAAAPDGTTAIRSSSSHTNLADTGSVDTTPYVVGGTTFLGMGTALLLASRRRALPYA